MAEPINEPILDNGGHAEWCWEELLNHVAWAFPGFPASG